MSVKSSKVRSKLIISCEKVITRLLSLCFNSDLIRVSSLKTLTVKPYGSRSKLVSNTKFTYWIIIELANDIV